MPAARQGNATPATTTRWAASVVHALGDLVTPSTPTGQYFICITAGTSAAAEPAWSGPTFPTIGTTFTDGGGVVWSCAGSNVESYIAPVTQEPVDSDEPISSGIVIPDDTLADYVALLQKELTLGLGLNVPATGTTGYTVATDSSFSTLVTYDLIGSWKSTFGGVTQTTRLFRERKYGGFVLTRNAFINPVNPPLAWQADNTSLQASITYLNSNVGGGVYPALATFFQPLPSAAMGNGSPNQWYENVEFTGNDIGWQRSPLTINSNFATQAGSSPACTNVAHYGGMVTDTDADFEFSVTATLNFAAAPGGVTVTNIQLPYTLLTTSGVHVWPTVLLNTSGIQGLTALGILTSTSACKVTVWNAGAVTGSATYEILIRIVGGGP